MLVRQSEQPVSRGKSKSAGRGLVTILAFVTKLLETKPPLRSGDSARVFERAGARAHRQVPAHNVRKRRGVLFPFG